jgi:hypothetical protein
MVRRIKAGQERLASPYEPRLCNGTGGAPKVILA